MHQQDISTSIDSTDKEVKGHRAVDTNTLSALRDAVGGDDANSFVAELIEDYLADAPRRIAAMQAAISTGDVEQFRDNVHTLKSTSSTIGAFPFADLCLILENQAREGNIPERELSLSPLLASFEHVQSDLRTILLAYDDIGD